MDGILCFKATQKFSTNPCFIKNLCDILGDTSTHPEVHLKSKNL